jgi:hypothetical protein
MMWSNKCVLIVACAALLAMPSLAFAVSLPVSNPSFEVGPFDMYWGIQLDAGGDGTIPGWTYANSAPWTNWAVALNNVNPYIPPMNNVDVEHWATLPMYGGGGTFYQDIDPSVVFEEGLTYTFTTAMLQRSDNYAPPTDQILASLFYRPVAGDWTQTAGAADISLTYGDLPVDTFTDFSISFTPQAGDPCIGKTMGVLFYNANSNATDGSYYGIDNVRVTVTPEPSSIVLALLVALGAGAYAWRKRK